MRDLKQGLMTRRLIVATRNRAKVAVVAPLPYDISHEINPESDAKTTVGSLRDLAAAKALAWSLMLGHELVVATDGGLLIPALGEAWNPARTRRFAGEEVDDVERARALLALANDLTGDQRRIGWREALALASHGELLGLWSAESGPGLLATDVDPRLIAAGHGFWVPAVWVCPECGGRRLAELSEGERASRLDHWDRLGVELRATFDTLPG